MWLPQFSWKYAKFQNTSCACCWFASCWCLMMALHSDRVGERGAPSEGRWTWIDLSLMVTIRTDCLPGIATSCFVTGGTLFEDEVFLDAEHLSRSFGCLDLNLADLCVFSEALLTAVGDGLATMIFLPEGCLKCNVVSLIIVSLQIRRLLPNGRQRQLIHTFCKSVHFVSWKYNFLLLAPPCLWYDPCDHLIHS